MLSPCTEVNIKHGPLHKNLTLAGPVAVLYSYREARINKVLLNHAESHWAECVSIVPCGPRREGGRGRWPSDLLIGHSTLRLARVCFACVTSAPCPKKVRTKPITCTRRFANAKSPSARNSQGSLGQSHAKCVKLPSALPKRRQCRSQPLL